MIPKIIHYCWLSGEEYPKKVKSNIATWKKVLPDYEFILWDRGKADSLEIIWVEQAIEKKKFAFAADLIRLYALYNHGGIYLDSDVEVIKSFDDLLSRPYFFGAQHNDLIEAAVFGAVKNSDWLLDCMAYYKDREFVKKDGKLDMTVLPRVMKVQMENTKEIRLLSSQEATVAPSSDRSQNTLIVFPFDYFCAKNFETGQISVTKNTYTIHHFDSSWLPFFSKMRRGAVRVIGHKSTERFISILRLRSLVYQVRKAVAIL